MARLLLTTASAAAFLTRGNAQFVLKTDSRYVSSSQFPWRQNPRQKATFGSDFKYPINDIAAFWNNSVREEASQDSEFKDSGITGSGTVSVTPLNQYFDGPQANSYLNLGFTLNSPINFTFIYVCTGGQPLDHVALTGPSGDIVSAVGSGIASTGGPLAAGSYHVQAQCHAQASSDYASGSWSFTLTFFQPGDLRITKPHPTPPGRAQPKSQYISLQGVGSPGEQYEIDVLPSGSAVPIHSVSGSVDAEGRWEHVVLLTEYASVVQIRRIGDSTPSDQVLVRARPTLPVPGGPDFEQLKISDVFLSLGGITARAQQLLDGGFYSHAWIFVGSTDAQGTPEISESTGLGYKSQVISLDKEIAACGKIDIYRYSGTISDSQRDAVAASAIAYGNQGGPYWSIKDDWELYFDTEWYFDQGDPRMYIGTAAIKRLINRTDKFICSTLVWRSFLDGAGVDLAVPNIPPPSAVPIGLRVISTPYLVFLTQQNALIIPDTLALSGKLTLVSGTGM